ncbi:pilus assembly PilX family protein [Undibacterium sp. Ren11W]
MNIQFKNRQLDKGVALPVVLIFLVVMMLLGVTAIRNVTLGEKMAGNQRNQQLAFQAAEQALRYCENMVRTDSKWASVIQPVTTGPNNWEVDANWSNTKSVDILTTAKATAQGLAAPPRCMAENVSKTLALDVTETVRDQSIRAFRVTARATGGADTAVVMLQSYLKF